MAFALPQWVSERLGLAAELTEDQVAELEARGELKALGDVSWSAISTAIRSARPSRIELVRTIEVSKWRFTRLLIDSAVECTMVEIPLRDGVDTLPSNAAGSPPTDAELAICAAWLVDEGCDPEELRTKFFGHVLVCWTSDAASARVDLGAALTVAAIPMYKDIALPSGSCRDKSRIELASGAQLLEDSVFLSRMVQGALTQFNPSLRFLYYYRVFERAYLRAALKRFDAAFLSNPKDAVQEVSELMKSELNRLVSLVDGDSETKDWFVLFDEECVLLKNGGNNFVAGIVRASERPLGPEASWSRGCAYFYKMRCAIAHSGTSGPVYESYSDSEQACLSLLDIAEQAALQYLGVRSHYS